MFEYGDSLTCSTALQMAIGSLFYPFFIGVGNREAGDDPIAPRAVQEFTKALPPEKRKQMAAKFRDVLSNLTGRKG